MILFDKSLEIPSQFKMAYQTLLGIAQSKNKCWEIYSNSQPWRQRRLWINDGM